MVDLEEFIATTFTDECDGCHKESEKGKLLITINIDGDPFQLCEDCAKKLTNDLSHILNLDKKSGEQIFIVATDIMVTYTDYRRVKASSMEEAVEKYNTALHTNEGVCINVLLNDIIDKDGNNFSQIELL